MNLSFLAKADLGNLFNDMDIKKSKKVENYFNTKMDFTHLSTEEDYDSNDEIPFEFEKRIYEFEDKPKPNLDEPNNINVGIDKNPRELKIEHQLTHEHKHELFQFLKKYKDVFTWSYQDIPWLVTNIVMHKLAIKLEFTPIK